MRAVIAGLIFLALLAAGGGGGTVFLVKLSMAEQKGTTSAV